MLERLTQQYGPLMFHQSGGCCDGSSPMCYPIGEFRIGDSDVFLGRIGSTDTPFYIGGRQFEYWQHTALTVDVVPGRGSGFSVEAPEGMRSWSAHASSPMGRSVSSSTRVVRQEGCNHPSAERFEESRPR